MKNNNEKVKQISLDVVVGPKTDGEELANQVKEELERRGYTIFGAGFQADLTDEYHMNNEEDEDNIECLIAQLQEKLQKEYDVYIEHLRHEDTDTIISKSYKTIMLRSFLNCFIDSSDLLTYTMIIELIKYENVLEDLYEDWIYYHEDKIGIHKDFIFGHWIERNIECEEEK